MRLHDLRWMRCVVCAVAAVSFAPFLAAYAAESLNAYGPGGPAPAMREAVLAFEKRTGTKIEVTAGPTGEWKDKAKANADIIFSGSETMMADFIQAMEGAIDESSVTPLYLRPFSILVRPGNPRAVKGVADLFNPGLKVLVVNGAGQNGVWEDMAGRTGEIAKIRALRKNIVFHARSSAEARQKWIDDPSIDVWLIWSIWQVANPKLAQVVPIEARYAIYRDVGIALTQRGAARPAAKAFIDFLGSPEGAAIFRRWGWKA